MNSSYISIDLKTRFMPKEAGRLFPKRTTLTKPRIQPKQYSFSSQIPHSQSSSHQLRVEGLQTGHRMVSRSGAHGDCCRAIVQVNRLVVDTSPIASEMCIVYSGI